jgi:hypothetical protein
VRSVAEEWDQEIEIALGSLPFTLARAGIALVDVDLEPPLRAALQSLNEVEVGVYTASRSLRQRDRAGLLAAADEAMTARRWERMVGVLDEDALVAVYTPRQPESRNSLRLCTLVIEGEQMVIVSAAGDPEPLMELGLRELQQASVNCR